MNPHSLRLQNVRTFDEVQLDLPEGLLAVLGANGAGKSTLISAIDIALFGPEGRSLAPWYPRGLGTDPLLIELVFEHGGAIYRVRRSYSPKGRGQSKMELEREMAGDGFWEPLTLESQTATQEQVEDLIGLSRATFRASSYLAQGDAGAFCDAQPRDRKAILTEVVGLGDWDRFLERARSEKRACEMEIGEARALLDRADEELVLREELADARRVAVEDAEAARASLQNALAALTTARESHSEAVRQAERRSAATEALRATGAALGDLRERIGQREREIAELDQRLAQRDTLAERAESLGTLEAVRETLRSALALWRERQHLVEEMQQIEARAMAVRQKADQLEEQATAVLAGIGSEHCDRCGQVLGEDAARRAAESYRAEAASNVVEAATLWARHDECDTTLSAMPSERPDDERLPILSEQIRQAQEAGAQLAALDEVAARRRTAERELDEMRAELPERERLAATALQNAEALGPHVPLQGDRELMEVQRLERREHEVRAQLEAAQQAAARYDERLERLERVAQEAAETRELVEGLLATLNLRAAMERACSGNGIPALILESVAIPQVEVEATRLLRVLGGPATSVELRTQRETKTGGISDTLDIVLQTETGEAHYETFSGGERSRIAFALRLSLAQLLAGRKGATTGLLVVDEIDGLDAQGVAALVGVLEQLQQTVPRIIVVSHQAELRDAFPQALTLENVGGRSRIVESTAPVAALQDD